MAVYVDTMKANFGRMKMCHMMADTSEELLAMADRIGVQRKWLQYPGGVREHFDIAMSKRALAVRAGAIEVTMRDIGMLMRKRRGLDYDPNALTCRPQPAPIGDLFSHENKLRQPKK
ncbi:MAG: DUF4031 domain-containing protein [Roseibium sp.]|uniref:DUF4031 domain-containing protein n=1 Tax=Roseibium sp. TaxID=1936156 RepID=UPI0032982FC9